MTARETLMKILDEDFGYRTCDFDHASDMDIVCRILTDIIERIDKNEDHSHTVL